MSARAMLFITYPDWKERELGRLEAENPLVTCPQCDGKQERECRCSECDNYHTATCKSCDDDGKVRFKKLSEWERDNYVTPEMYEEALLGDAKLLAEWLVRDVTETLVEQGFHPWMDVSKWNRRLHVLKPYWRAA